MSLAMAILEYIPFLNHSVIQSIGQLLAKSSVAILINLALIFAVGIPCWFSEKTKATLVNWLSGVCYFHECHEYYANATR